MPELPEVETVRRTLIPHLLGSKVMLARLRRPDVCVSYDSSGSTLRPGAHGLLHGAIITQLARRGKQLALHAHDGRVLIIQLGMTGRVNAQTIPGSTARLRYPPHVHARWILTTPAGTTVACDFQDARRFGGLTEFVSPEDLHSLWWSRLGPDALNITHEALRDTLMLALAPSRRSIKAALLDQGVIAGVGNIYADESLFRCGVAPQRTCDSLTLSEITSLATSLLTVLETAVTLRGSTLRDYVDADGQRGSAGEQHAVYGRKGLACLTCATPLTSCLLAQRTTVWCTSCQR